MQFSRPAQVLEGTVWPWYKIQTQPPPALTAPGLEAPGRDISSRKPAPLSLPQSPSLRSLTCWGLHGAPKC